jgi:signal transduction histidine kinase
MNPVRVAREMVENALDYTPRGGLVSLSLTPEGENILVAVSDTGWGIPEDQMPYIFDRFYQLERRRTGQEGHSGLGLAIAKKILDLHERPITVASSPGSGTSFSFHLPSISPAWV